MYEKFGVSNKVDMMKNQFIGLADQGKIIIAMTEYAAQQVAAERERIKELEKQIERLKFDLDFAKSLLAQYADNED